MEHSDRIVALLEEIRDDQRAWIAESRAQIEKSMEAQDEALRVQAAMGRLYRKVLVVCVVVGGAAGAWLVFG